MAPENETSSSFHPLFMSSQHYQEQQHQNTPDLPFHSSIANVHLRNLIKDTDPTFCLPYNQLLDLYDVVLQQVAQPGSVLGLLPSYDWFSMAVKIREALRSYAHGPATLGETGKQAHGQRDLWREEKLLRWECTLMERNVERQVREEVQLTMEDVQLNYINPAVDSKTPYLNPGIILDSEAAAAATIRDQPPGLAWDSLMTMGDVTLSAAMDVDSLADFSGQPVNALAKQVNHQPPTPPPPPHQHRFEYFLQQHPLESHTPPLPSFLASTSTFLFLPSSTHSSSLAHSATLPSLTSTALDPSLSTPISSSSSTFSSSASLSIPCDSLILESDGETSSGTGGNSSTSGGGRRKNGSGRKSQTSSGGSGCGPESGSGSGGGGRRGGGEGGGGGGGGGGGAGEGGIGYNGSGGIVSGGGSGSGGGGGGGGGGDGGGGGSGGGGGDPFDLDNEDDEDEDDGDDYKDWNTQQDPWLQGTDDALPEFPPFTDEQRVEMEERARIQSVYDWAFIRWVKVGKGKKLNGEKGQGEQNAEENISQGSGPDPVNQVNEALAGDGLQGIDIQSLIQVNDTGGKGKHRAGEYVHLNSSYPDPTGQFNGSSAVDEPPDTFGSQIAKALAGASDADDVHEDVVVDQESAISTSTTDRTLIPIHPLEDDLSWKLLQALQGQLAPNNPAAMLDPFGLAPTYTSFNTASAIPPTPAPAPAPAPAITSAIPLWDPSPLEPLSTAISAIPAYNPPTPSLPNSCPPDTATPTIQSDPSPLNPNVSLATLSPDTAPFGLTNLDHDTFLAALTFCPSKDATSAANNHLVEHTPSDSTSTTDIPTAAVITTTTTTTTPITSTTILGAIANITDITEDPSKPKAMCSRDQLYAPPDPAMFTRKRRTPELSVRQLVDILVRKFIPGFRARRLHPNGKEERIRREAEEITKGHTFQGLQAEPRGKRGGEREDSGSGEQVQDAAEADVQDSHDQGTSSTQAPQPRARGRNQRVKPPKIDKCPTTCVDCGAVFLLCLQRDVPPKERRRDSEGYQKNGYLQYVGVKLAKKFTPPAHAHDVCPLFPTHRLMFGWNLVPGANSLTPAPLYANSTRGPKQPIPIDPQLDRSSTGALYPAHSLISAFVHILPRQTILNQYQIRKLFSYFIWHKYFDTDLQAISLRKEYAELLVLFMMMDEEDPPSELDLPQYCKIHFLFHDAKKICREPPEAWERVSRGSRDKETGKVKGMNGLPPEYEEDRIGWKLRMEAMAAKFSSEFDMAMLQNGVDSSSREMSVLEKYRHEQMFNQARGWFIRLTGRRANENGGGGGRGRRGGRGGGGGGRGGRSGRGGRGGKGGRGGGSESNANNVQELTAEEIRSILFQIKRLRAELTKAKKAEKLDKDSTTNPDEEDEEESEETEAEENGTHGDSDDVDTPATTSTHSENSDPTASSSSSSCSAASSKIAELVAQIAALEAPLPKLDNFPLMFQYTVASERRDLRFQNPAGMRDLAESMSLPENVGQDRFMALMNKQEREWEPRAEKNRSRQMFTMPRKEKERHEIGGDGEAEGDGESDQDSDGGGGGDDGEGDGGGGGGDGGGAGGGQASRSGRGSKGQGSKGGATKGSGSKANGSKAASGSKTTKTTRKRKSENPTEEWDALMKSRPNKRTRKQQQNVPTALVQDILVIA